MKHLKSGRPSHLQWNQKRTLKTKYEIRLDYFQRDYIKKSIFNDHCCYWEIKNYFRTKRIVKRNFLMTFLKKLKSNNFLRKNADILQKINILFNTVSHTCLTKFFITIEWKPFLMCFKKLFEKLQNFWKNIRESNIFHSPVVKTKFYFDCKKYFYSEMK